MAYLNNDFSQYVAGAAPSDWTRRWTASPGTWTIVAGGGKDGVKNALQSTSLGGGRNAFSWNAFDNLSDRENIDILARVKSTISSNQDFQFFVRASGAVTFETGYRGGVANNTRRTDRYDNGTAYSAASWGVANTNIGPTLAAETWYLIRYRAEGAVFSASLWLDDGIATEPATPHFTITDPTPNLIPGWVGLFQGVINGRTSFDEIAFATAGDVATFDPPVDLTITDSLTLTDPGSSFAIVHTLTVTDALGLKDSVVTDLVSNFKLVITDSMGIADTEVIGGQFFKNITVVDAMELVDDVLQQTIIPGIPSDVVLATRGVEIIQELINAGYDINTIMDRERLRLLAKTGANPVGNSLQDLYYLAGERPRL